MWFYSRAADAGDTWSMVQLGIVYEEGLGGTENPTLALAYFERAAAAGNARGDYGMGRILTAGLAEGGRNERRALEHFCKAAEAGVSGAQLQAGLAYLAGRGTARNPATAAGWLRKAADAGETEAQAIVGEMLWQGNGVPADKAEARRLAEASAAAGCERGVRLLAALNSPPAPLQKLQAFGEDTGINKIVGGVWPSLDRFFNKRP
jgi:TPR repeat protein